ncbi:MAG: hypothetical protein Ct9H300mP11_27300 [Chloroflexota bacterium]|nr:MAG: hypothetical protein Ct9H300mP11_27300 [Chloroflexota bacterium]
MAPEIMKGLKDVYLDTTESSFIDGEEGNFSIVDTISTIWLKNPPSRKSLFATLWNLPNRSQLLILIKF